MSEKRYKKILVISGTGLAVYLCFKYLLSLLVPFSLVFFIASVLRRPVRFLNERLRIPTVVGGLASILLFLSFLGSILFFLCRSLVQQVVNLIQQFPDYYASVLSRYDTLCAGCDRIFRLEQGTAGSLLDSQLSHLSETIQTTVLPSLTERSLRLALGIMELLALFIIILVAALLLMKDMKEYSRRFRSSAFAPMILKILDRLKTSALAYLKTQGIILLLTAAVCTVALLIIDNPYALLLGICIALIDAFPVLGSGTVLIPWCIVLCFQRQFFSAAILMTAFVISLFLREFLEPKLFGKEVGIRPLYTLAAIFLGIRLFGVAGFLLGPLALVILKSVCELEETGNLHTKKPN